MKVIYIPLQLELNDMIMLHDIGRRLIPDMIASELFVTRRARSKMPHVAFE